MKKLILFLSICFLISCQDKFNPNKLRGSWISLDSEESFNYILPTFTFKNDSVYIIDVYGYATKVKFKFFNNKMSFISKDDTLEYNFEYRSNDSTLIIDNNEYINYPGFVILKNDFINYELLDLKTEKNITSDSLSKFDNGFHLFKDINDSLRLKLNDRILSDFESIPSFVIGHHQTKSFGSVIYTDKKIKLKDLIKCYTKLWQVNQKSNLLITGYDIKTNLYSGFKDRIEFWQEQTNLYFKEKNKPINPKALSRSQYIKKYTPKTIKINSDIDFNKLNTINKENNYLIQINIDIPLETYIYLKEKISNIKKKESIRIKTEFNLHPQLQ